MQGIGQTECEHKYRRFTFCITHQIFPFVYFEQKWTLDTQWLHKSYGDLRFSGILHSVLWYFLADV